MMPAGFRLITCLDFDMRALVIGAGPTTVHEHLPVLAKLRDAGHIVLAFVCDIDRGRAAAARQRFGFLEDGGDATAALQRTDLDAVYIFGSAQLHYEYGLLALQNGKHLFVEKPVAPSYEQAMVLADLARRSGLIAVGGLNRRFFKSLTEVRARAGKAGWRFAEAVFHKAELGKAPPFGARTWLGANGIHALDAQLFVMGGLPENITSVAEDMTGASAPGAFSALMRWRNGAQGVFLCNNNAGSRREEYVFHGQGETCSVDGDALLVEKNGVSTRISLPAIGDGFAAEHAAFLQAIRTTTEPLHSLSAIAPSLFLAELIEAGFSGRVELPAMASPASTSARDPEKKSILVVHSTELQPGLARLLPYYRLVSVEDIRDSADPRPDVLAAVLGRGSAPLPREVLDKLPRLGVVGVMALSLARHEPQTLLERGITVVNASAAYADSVAEFALGLAILARRRAFGSHAVMRSGGWGTDLGVAGIKGVLYRAARAFRPSARAIGIEAFALKLWRGTTAAKSRGAAATATISRDLQGSVVGLLGWGENARVFAAHLLRLEARVLVYSEHASAEDIRAVGASPASLGEALSADIVSLHRGLTASTHHFLGEPELAKLRPGTVLINTARGALIDPTALVARLREGDIFACLDTFEGEPLPASHPLRDLPNVFLTSHIAGGSKDMHAAAADEVIRKVAAYLNGHETKSISAARLSTMT
jgi:phosphoglycerate dehydrogenase-like enzyme/predicted dehydrogenase